MKRCAWATTPLGIAYHDAEWGVPVHDDRVLFEFLKDEQRFMPEAIDEATQKLIDKLEKLRGG